MLEERARREEVQRQHLPVGKPGDSVVMPDLPPFLAGKGVLRDSLTLPYVNGDVPRVDTLLEFAHLGMLTPPPKEPWGLHSEVAHLCDQQDQGQRGSRLGSAQKLATNSVLMQRDLL